MRKWGFEINFNIFFLGVLLLFAGCAKDSLHRACPSRCISIQDQPSESSKKALREFQKKVDAPKSTCKFGKPVCNEEMEIIECNGVVFPSEEMCNGINDDCDNQVDESIGDYQPKYFREDIWGVENPCFSIHGECAKALVKCDRGGEGGWWCDYFANDADVRETDDDCDGKDNNCNGRVDEDFIGNFCFGPGVVPAEDWWKATVDPCRPGAELCVEDVEGSPIIECVGDVLPSIEFCDMSDNDCNGIIDDIPGFLFQQYDIVFIVDTSGSMCPFIAAVAAALDAYVEQFEGNPNFRFALVLVTYTGDANGDGVYNYQEDLVYKLVDFTDLATVRDELLSLTCYDSGLEASLDGMRHVCDVTNNPLQLSWDPQSNKMFMAFSDENCQTYAMPPTTPADVVFECTLHNVLPFMWSTDWSRACYENIAMDANGLFFTISNGWVNIFDDLNSIVITLCEAEE